MQPQTRRQSEPESGQLSISGKGRKVKRDKHELTPEQRKLRAQMAAYALHAQHDPRETTKAATRAAQITRFERQVDPDGVLAPEERARRVEAARRSYMRGLALKRSRAASRKRAEREGIS